MNLVVDILHPSDGFPAQFLSNRLTINKGMLVYFLVDFVTVLFCYVLTQSVCFWPFNLIRLIDHLSYQSNGDLILCYFATCIRFWTKTIYRIKHKDHEWNQEQAYTTCIEKNEEYNSSLWSMGCIRLSIASGDHR